MSLVMFCFPCCVDEQPPPGVRFRKMPGSNYVNHRKVDSVDSFHTRQKCHFKRRRPRIDRTQIGLPTNFQHTGHIGSGEVASGFDVHQVQHSMMSKGGYEQSLNENDSTPSSGVELMQKSSETSNGTSLPDQTDDNCLSPPNEININIESNGVQTS